MNDNPSGKQIAGLILLGLIIVIALTWVSRGNDFFLSKFFAPKQEAVRREVFEESKAFNQGMVQELQNMRFQYEQASSEHKAALASIILHRAADYDMEKLPPDLRSFIEGLRSNPSGNKEFK